MKTKVPVAIILPAIVTFLFSCKESAVPVTKTGGPELVEFRALPFGLHEVRLLEGPFLHATELNIRSLLNYDPDRFLARFRTEAGLPAKAEPYHGWEDATISGHSLGHYLSACALMYNTCHDPVFLERVNYIVDELALCQDAHGNGYMGAIPGGKRILEEEVAQGNIRSRGFDLNGLWVPWYAHHKMMAGLRDAYHLCGNRKALALEEGFAAWTEEILSGLDDEQVQRMLNCEHGGMNEVLADLYADTGDERWLQLSGKFHHRLILDPLAAGNDILPGKHGNTNIPKFIGLARRYELTADSSDRKAAEFFWERVVNHHSYVTGGHGQHEHFGPPDTLRNRLSNYTSESCNVYNMLKLTGHLFSWTASPHVADFYERALFNHILSSQHPLDGRVIYNLSLDMGGYKSYQDPLWFTCCIGTGMENHSKYGGCIYYHNDRELFVNQFIASELNWNGKGINLKQLTGYPEEQGTRLEFTCREPVRLCLRIRYPGWAEQGAEVFINERKIKYKESAGSYITLDRKWQSGDVVDVRFPFSLRLECMPDDSNRIAILFGPLVLAAELGPVEDDAALDPMYVPVLLTTGRDPSRWTEALENQQNCFRTKEIGQPRDVILRPFNQFHDKRYSVYLDMMSGAAWEKYQAGLQARIEALKKLEEMTVDFVQPGDSTSESNHKFRGERSGTGEFRNRKYREARNGWFSYEMKTNPGQPIEIVAEYFGGFPGSRTFDILVDGKPVVTENISTLRDGENLVKYYEIPFRLTTGRKKVTLSFRAREGNTVGPVFGIRTLAAGEN